MAHEEHSEKVRFKPPKGWMPPDGSEKDGKFDIVDTWKIEEDGQLCLIKLGDHDMKYEEHEKKENKPDYSEVSKPMMSSLGGGASAEGSNPGMGGY